MGDLEELVELHLTMQLGLLAACPSGAVLHSEHPVELEDRLRGSPTAFHAEHPQLLENCSQV